MGGRTAICPECGKRVHQRWDGGLRPHLRPKEQERKILRARQRVAEAIKSGQLRRRITCQFCGRRDQKLVGHHADYNFPLTVVWLCPSCHKRMHADDKASDLACPFGKRADKPAKEA